VAAESGEKRAIRFRELEAQYAAKAENYRKMAERIEKGNAGETQVAGLLDVLDGAGWRVLNDRYQSSQSPVNIDHILIGPPGVCVIDSKNWSGGRLTFDNRGMTMGRYRRDDELRSVKEAANVVGRRAQQAVAEVITGPVLAFAQPVGLEAPVFEHGVVCLEAGQLLSWLTSVPQNLTPQQVHQLGSTLDAAFPPRVGGQNPFIVAAMTRAPKTQRRPPSRGPSLTRRAGYGVLAAAADGVRDLTSWATRAAIALTLILLWIAVGIPLTTKAIEATMQHMLPAPTATANPHPTPTPGPHRLVTPAKKAAAPRPRASTR
jgi:hypothetical protein